MKPKYFMPFHGEYRMLKQHADLAISCDVPKENTFVLENGDVLSMYKGKVTRAGKITAEDIYVDGNRIGDVGSIVIKDRNVMANDGIIVVIANVDTKNNTLLGRVNITTRGFVQINENEELLRTLENVAKSAILSKLDKHISYSDIKNEIVTNVSSYVFNKTGRKPIILPVIMDIKRG